MHIMVLLLTSVPEDSFRRLRRKFFSPTLLKARLPVCERYSVFRQRTQTKKEHKRTGQSRFGDDLHGIIRTDVRRHIMQRIRGYKYRAYPNRSQREFFAKNFGCCRFVYNHYLEKKQQLWKEWHDTLL